MTQKTPQKANLALLAPAELRGTRTKQSPALVTPTWSSNPQGGVGPEDFNFFLLKIVVSCELREMAPPRRVLWPGERAPNNSGTKTNQEVWELWGNFAPHGGRSREGEILPFSGNSPSGTNPDFPGQLHLDQQDVASLWPLSCRNPSFDPKPQSLRGFQLPFLEPWNLPRTKRSSSHPQEQKSWTDPTFIHFHPFLQVWRAAGATPAGISTWKGGQVLPKWEFLEQGWFSIC